jgi:hypothetical protein
MEVHSNQFFSKSAMWIYAGVDIWWYPTVRVGTSLLGGNPNRGLIFHWDRYRRLWGVRSWHRYQNDRNELKFLLVSLLSAQKNNTFVK